MSTGRRFSKTVGVLVLCLGALGVGVVIPANATSSNSQRKTKKAPKPQLAPLPAGPTGPVQQIPLDSIAPVPPQVSYQNAQLTIVAQNSTLGDILRAVRKQTGAEIEIPAAPERVVTHLGPGPARDVVAELLNGSRFNYVLLGSAADNAVLTRVVLVAKAGPDNATPNNPNASITADPSQPGAVSGIAQGMVQQPGNPGAPEPVPDANASEDNTDDAADQAAAEAEQPANPDQPAVKTPQQMLQEMQQRQLQIQQQQPSGQPPIPGTAVPQRPPQDQQ
jgi:hypothetical protein